MSKNQRRQSLKKHRLQTKCEGRISTPNTDVVLHQQHDARVAFCAKHDSHEALQNVDLIVTFQHQNASLISFTFQTKRERE